jgi:hypothetical protein
VHSLSRDRGVSPPKSRRTIAAAAGESIHRPTASDKEKAVIEVVIWSDIV